MTEIQEIAEVVKAINDCWIEGRYDDLQPYFHENMVLALPGFEQRIEGARAIIDSYREFGEKATIDKFAPELPQIDVIGPTAVATANFDVQYQLEGATYHESGTDLLVFRQSDEAWQVIWRSVLLGN